jgi:predicted RNase H-like nuclease (RuvC/YqgF family)
MEVRRMKHKSGEEVSKIMQKFWESGLSANAFSKLPGMPSQSWILRHQKIYPKIPKTKVEEAINKVNLNFKQMDDHLLRTMGITMDDVLELKRKLDAQEANVSHKQDQKASFVSGDGLTEVTLLKKENESLKRTIEQLRREMAMLREELSTTEELFFNKLDRMRKRGAADVLT